MTGTVEPVDGNICLLIVHTKFSESEVLQRYFRDVSSASEEFVSETVVTLKRKAIFAAESRCFQDRLVACGNE
ncbi:MAG: hypothetical protein KAR40_08640 [Candidatus Sabulitectum sp.]|nr:hypothetical protein [Candidatus Sabulitectum sp.]